MRLFGIVANISKHTDKQAAANKVSAYLYQITNQQEAGQYLQMFDFHARQYSKEARNYEKRLSALGVKATIIAEEVKVELNQHEKILIIVSLLEIHSTSTGNIATGFDFIRTMARIFYIDAYDYENCKSLVFWDSSSLVHPKDFLIIHGTKGRKPGETEHVYHAGLDGEIIFLNTSVNTILFKYHLGDEKLYVNERKIVNEQCYLLSKGASIRSYKIAPVYYTDVARILFIPGRLSNIRLEVKDASYRFPEGSTGIQPFNLNEQGGQLIGVMGSSGSGKTTLLNLLNGNLQPSKGKVFINGHDVHKEQKEITGIIGYVPQDDLLIEELTVYQNLHYNALLCLKNLEREQIHNKIVHLLKDLELYEIKDFIVGNPLQKVISGGQRKRLNLALEFIREPSIFFIDEPTSGLSSNDAEKLIDLLKTQTLQGALMIVNIHQPSSDIYKQFDKIIILDQGGYVIFVGNPLDATTYFKTETDQLNATESECLSCGNVNPGQIFHIIEQKKTDAAGYLLSGRKFSPTDWYHKFRSKQNSRNEQEARKLKLPDNVFQPPGIWKQFCVFFHRNIQSKLQDKQYLLVGLLEAPVLALILAYFSRYTKKLEYTTQYIFLDNENLPVFLFMMAIVAMFLGLMVSAEQIIQDRKILQREQFLHLHRAGYIHSKIAFLFILSAIQAVTFVFIGNVLLSIRGMGLPFFLMFFTIACNANMLGLNISSGFRSLVTIYILIPVLLVPQLLLSGATLSFDRLPASIRHPKYVPVIGDMIIARWAYEGLMVHQFKSNNYQKHFMKIDRKISRSSFMANYLLPELENAVAGIDFQLRSNVLPAQNDWKLVLNEVKALEQYKNKTMESLPNRVEEINSETINELSSFLKEVRLVYTQLTNYYITEKDNIIENLRGKGIDLVKMKEDHVNNRISDIVTAKNQKQKISIMDNEIIRKAEPVFFSPDSKLGRAHFYAPEKRLFMWNVETFWFNLIFIWVITIFLYIFLQMDFLRKAMDFVENNRKLFGQRVR